MKEPASHDETRRWLVRTILVAPIALASPSLLGLTRCSSGPNVSTVRSPTPACSDGDDDEATEAQTEGPFFKTNSPERTSLIEAGVQGTRLLLTGSVITRSCRPVAGALIDFWQADDSGNYDNVTFRLRGHQFTDAQGAYQLDTIVPGLYPGRTRHIHVKAQAPGQSILTTQLYFPGESRNASDGIFDADLLVDMTATASGREGRFNFVLDIA
ncbi:MAG: dioxygenase [Gemmatimonadaceae bacterium]